MKTSGLLILLAFTTGFILVLSSPVVAQGSFGERITSFTSEIKLHADSSMTVTETIKVTCQRINIHHGIYRDFPTRYKDAMGNNRCVGFEILWVKRGGRDEPYRIKPYSNGRRVYIGDSKTFLKAGTRYTYKIKYRTTRQLGYFDDHDELFWNVTGNGWNFPIDFASTTVILPDGVTGDDISLVGYTGRQGEKGKSYISSADESGKCRYATTSRLNPGEGLSIAVGFPKGFVHEPTRIEKIKYFIMDNMVLIIGILSLLFLLAFYIPVWMRFGKDMPKGTVIPLFEPPEGISPAAMRFIKRMGYDNRIFAAAIINMAVKGFISISQSDFTYTITRYVPFDTAKNYDLAPEEELIARKLLYFDDYFTITNENHKRIRKTVDALKNKLHRFYENQYFVTNASKMFPGLVISFLALTGMILLLMWQGGLGWVQDFLSGSFLAGAGVVVFIYIMVPQIMRFAHGNIGGFRALGNGLIILLLGIGFGSFGLAHLLDSSTVFLGLFVAAFIFVNVLFYHLLKAPTSEGRKILDQIEGFRMYLTVAEKDRLNYLNPPRQTPELFEKYLPYALALDVEQQWGDQFALTLLEAEYVDISEYSPTWFDGGLCVGALTESAFISSMVNSMANAISSSSQPPGSESGFSAASGAGGGGGGGGGGGW